ncbi:MAG: inorganic diphosphatase [archaeon]
MESKEFLGKVVHVKIDRPMGSRHPRIHDIYYVYNYGYLPGVPAPDGEDLDAYVLGVFEPVQEFTGECIAVIHRLDDVEDKLVIVPEGKTYTDDQIRAMTEFQEKYFTSIILR